MDQRHVVLERIGLLAEDEDSLDTVALITITVMLRQVAGIVPDASVATSGDGDITVYWENGTRKMNLTFVPVFAHPVYIYWRETNTNLSGIVKPANTPALARCLLWLRGEIESLV